MQISQVYLSKRAAHWESEVMLTCKTKFMLMHSNTEIKPSSRLSVSPQSNSSKNFYKNWIVYTVQK